MTKIDHTGLYTADIDGYIDFFTNVFGMKVSEVIREDGMIRNVWLDGGVQLTPAPGFKGPEGRHYHLALNVDSVRDVLRKAEPYGVTAMPQGMNWIRLKDGLCIELLDKEFA